MEDLELLSFNIISAVGTAKSRYVQAMYLAEKGDFDEARAKIKEGEESFVKGHEAHAHLSRRKHVVKRQFQQFFLCMRKISL